MVGIVVASENQSIASVVAGDREKLRRTMQALFRSNEAARRTPPTRSSMTRITGTTRVFCILGDPVAQVRAPEVYNHRCAIPAVRAS